jgi:uncharacterized protein (TIGR02466 family)
MNHQILDLFSIPLYQSKINTIDIITYTKLTTSEWEDPGYSDIPVTHKETSERHILNLPYFSKLKKEVQDHVDFYVYEILGVSKAQSWEITTSWVNKSSPGNYHSNHWHSNSMVSGVLYLSSDSKSGAICFNKDRGHSNLWGDTICIDFEKDTPYNIESVGVIPKVNDILIFPSILNHSVLINQSNIDRYSLAFNVFPRGIVGKGGNSELTL